MVAFSGSSPAASQSKAISKMLSLTLRGVGVVGGEGVPVGDKEKTVVVVLEPGPVLQGADVVANVQFACRSHAAEYAAVHSLFCF